MMEDIKISLVTVSYNNEKTISKTIESVLAQTYTNLEYLIMDGDSTDKTVEVAESYRSKFEEKGINYKVISRPDKGMYDALNNVIALCEGVIIGSVNSDDYYEPHTAQVVAEEYQKEPFDMIYGDLKIIKPTGNIIKKAKLKKFVTTRNWNHPTTFITRETYSKEKYSCVNMYDDCDLMLRLRKKGYKVRVVNKVLSNFVFGGMSTEKNWKKTCDRIKCRCEVYKKNGYGFLYYVDSAVIEIIKFVLG